MPPEPFEYVQTRFKGWNDGRYKTDDYHERMRCIIVIVTAIIIHLLIFRV